MADCVVVVVDCFYVLFAVSKVELCRLFLFYFNNLF